MKQHANIIATLGASLLGLGIRIHKALPRSWDLWLVQIEGFLFGRMAGRMRKPLLNNLTGILGMNALQANRTADKVFQNFALTLHDFFIHDGVTIDVPQKNQLEKVRQEGRGILALTFHLGHWELGARTMQSWGWPVTAVYQPYRNKKFKHLIESHRAPGVHFLPVGGQAAKGVRESLRKGHIVAMLGDHPFGEDGAPVQLLGKPVMWPRGPIVLAVRESCPIVVAVIVRKGQQTYQAIIEEPLYPQARTLAEADRLMQCVADIFGSVVKKFPDQWMRFRPLEPAPDSISTLDETIKLTPSVR